MDGEDLGLLDGGGTEEVELGGDEEVFDEEISGGGDEETPAEEGEGRTDEEGRHEEDGEGERGSRRVDRADLPLQLRKALRANPEIAKQFPKLEKQLSGALFKANSVDQLGGVQKFRDYAETLDAHGGPEGVANMAAELEQWNELDRGFENGDPKVVDGWIKDYPAGFRSLLPVAIEKLDATDMKAHDAAVSPSMWKIFDRCGVLTTMGALEAAIAALEPEKAKEVLKEFGLLKGFFGDVRQLAVKAKSPDPLAADRQRLNEEREGVQGERDKMFYGSVRQDVNGQIMSKMNQLIRQELAGAKVKLSVANRLRKEINGELARQVNSAKGYSERYKAVMSAGDKDRAVRFIVAAANAKLPGVVKALVSEFNLRRPSRTNSSGDRGGERRMGDGGKGSRVVSGRPKTSEVDFTRMDQARWLGMVQRGHGEAPLKSGKVAKW